MAHLNKHGVALWIIAAQGHHTLEDLHVSGILNTRDVL